jgi:hypothetical protein
MVTYTQLAAMVSGLGYAWFDSGDYNLNLVGVRGKSREPGKFDDRLHVAFRQCNQPVVLTFAVTTDPGEPHMRKPINPLGAAILKPGQYRRMWQIGMHQSRYRALVQRGVCTVFRDNNRDAVLDDGPVQETGYFGINLHHARDKGATVSVDAWSAGCQVMADHEEFQLVMSLCALASQRYGNSFTYTLLEDVL